jgi:hypothetical protein
MDSRTRRSFACRCELRQRGPVSPLLAVVLGLVAVLALGNGMAQADASAPSVAADTYTGHWTQPAAVDAAAQAAETTASAVYQSQYGLFPAKNAVKPTADELARLAALLSFARAAAARVNARYQAALQPEMVLWWTHADGIRARVNYSNCANEQDQYFSHLHNCDKPWFWQLGAAADQFSYVVYLQTAVDDMYGPGASGNAALVQRLGQQVLDFDQHLGTTPMCGGYSCTFPTTTIGALMQNVSLQQQTDANWYASLLMRDPGVGSWMTARALRNFSHEQTRGWVGCYYAASCWQRLSDRLGDILGVWPTLVQQAAALPPGDPVNPAPIATATDMPTASPTATDTPAPTATATDAPAPSPAATATPALAGTPTGTPTDTPTATATDTPPSTASPGDGPLPCRLPIGGAPYSSDAAGAAKPLSPAALAIPECYLQG